MKTRHLFEVSLLCLLGLLYACVHDPTIEEQRSNTHNDLLTVSAAREFVEKQLSLKTRAHTTKSKGLEPGDFSPLWNEAKMSQNAKVGSVDVPIIPQYNYYALRCEEKNGKIKVHKVRISQKVVVIKAKDNGRLSSYLLTLIPDGDYYAKNKNKFDEFLNSGSHNFSGVVVYYDIHARHTVRVNKYVKGHKTAGIYLMCNSKDWDKRVKIAKKILGPIRIAKSANKMTRSFDEEPDPCPFCGDPWCWGDCEEEEWLYCWNCGSSWCNGDCDDDPIIITPDYCSGCGEYEFNCTCNVCSWCGNDPCTCDDTCSWCGNDPCTCGTCPDCGDDPCTCEEWECPKCGDPFCSGNCSSLGETKPDPGKDDDTTKKEPKEPMEIDCEDVDPNASKNGDRTSNLYTAIANDVNFTNFVNAVNKNPLIEYGTTAYIENDGGNVTVPDIRLTSTYTDGLTDNVQPRFKKGENVANLSMVHNHPSESPCSVPDILALIKSAQFYPTFESIYVYTLSGDMYAIYLYDRTRLKSFLNGPLGETAIRGYVDEAATILNQFEMQGYDKHLYSLAYALKALNTGIAILSKDKNSPHFKQHNCTGERNPDSGIVADLELTKCKE